MLQVIVFILFVIILIVFFNKKKIEQKESDFLQMIEPFEEKLTTIITKQYINYSFFLKLSKEHKEISKSIKKTKRLVEKFPLFFEFQNSDKYRKSLNDIFIKAEKERIGPIFKQHDKYGLTEKQLEGVICDEDAVLVNAGAGTGKTKTIEGKVVYLHTEKHIPLNKILVITFSKKSQLEMLDRIKKSLKTFNINVDDRKLTTHIATFHAFGYGILKDAYGKFIYDEDEKEIGIGFTGKRVIDEKDQNDVIQMVYEKIKNDDNMADDLIKFLLYFSSPQHKVSDFSGIDEYYEAVKKEYRTQLINDRGLNVTVKSYGELIIANHLWSCGINVQYEPKNHYIKDDEGNKQPYKPDFYLPDYDIYIEYFGVDGNNQTADYIDAEDYVDRMSSKIEKHRRSKTQFIDLRYADYLNGGWLYLTDKLNRELKKYGVNAEKKKNYEIIEILERPLNDLEQTLKTFLALYKESGENIKSLQEKIKNFDPINRERNQKFLSIFETYLKLYTNLLSEGGYIDFGDMIVDATNLIKDGTVLRNYSYILVDEFQDISPARANLINALIKDPDETRLFSVGDDWQSIYKFAGSNTNIFIDFDKYFGYTEKITLDKTFRFNQGISNISGQFVMENPKQSRKELQTQDEGTKNKILIFQNDVMFNYGEIGVTKKEKLKEAFHYNNIFYRILDDHVENHCNTKKKTQKLSILYLTRYALQKYEKQTPVNFIRYFKDYVGGEKNSDGSYTIKYKKHIFNVSINHLTIHKSKGLEADYVIVDFINQNTLYDFPSSMIDDPILDLVTENDKGAFPHVEERRVFYVAMTRGKRLAFLIYDKGKESCFLSNLIKYKSNSIHTVQNKKGENLTLVENNECAKCEKCGGRLIPSQYEKDIPEYYCSHYMVGCNSFYYELEGKLYRFENCHKLTCDGRMVMKTNKNDGSHFLGCSNYPYCRQKQKICVKNN